MSQASILSDNDIRRVFRIIETTRHSDRNRLAFVLSIFAGMRVGEIAALTVGDVANQHGEARREIKLAAHQTKGSKGRTIVVSARVQKEIESYVMKTRPFNNRNMPLICSQRRRQAFSSLTLSMLFGEIYYLAGIALLRIPAGEPSHATRLNAKGVGMRTIQKLMGIVTLEQRLCTATCRTTR